MGEPKNRWNWEIPGFEPRKSIDIDDEEKPIVMQRYSISATASLPHSELSKHVLAAKLQKLKDQVKVTPLFSFRASHFISYAACSAISLRF